ncbi:MAG: class I SAM-dependent methyltransferase [Arenicella sp.]|nr:class I SAM-dependent methyltransferase [Arenicella sp.]
MKYLRLKHASVSISGAGDCPIIGKLVNCCELTEKPQRVDLELSEETNGLNLIWNNGDQKPLKYHLDFVKSVSQLRSFPAPKQGAFNQALGKKSRSIIDATGGWAGDAMLMCLQGYKVIVIERLPLMAALIEEAFWRLAKSEYAANNSIVVPTVLWGNAAELLADLGGGADCVYLDPMFPVKKKKKAASNKQMQLLQWLAGADFDASDVASIAKQNFPRLAVKRPDYAEPLLAEPAIRFSSKLVHYDVYM